MTDNTNNKAFHGVVTPMVTPFTASGDIDRDALARLIDHLVEGGVAGIFLMGTTGEGASMTVQMQRELIELAATYIAGRTRLLVHVADPCLERSIALGKFAAAAGADYAVAALPYYFSLTQAEIKDYYCRLADALPLPLFLYNIPAQTKMMIAPATVLALASHPNIIGMKDSSGNGTYFNTLLATVKPAHPDFAIMVGPDEMLASTMSMGGDGGVNSGSNLFPRLYTALYEACRAGDRDRIAALQALVMRVSTDIYSIDSSPVSFMKGLKAAMASRGLIANCVLPPLVPACDADSAVIDKNTAALAELIASTL
ncbi:MAG: dihydrodipicolinate synthase family protein [Bacteroides sp.]|nr:dihydrodipicolinate synthase family protein [Bacteroides sp.]MCM1095217.1 dihydrodipicolinate synthase family protein [Terasakiella sp.]